MQGGGISLCGSHVSLIIVPGVGWPCWGLIEVWPLYPPCHTPVSDSLRACVTVSCPPKLSPPHLWSSTEAAQGTPGSLGGGHSWDRIPGQEPGTGNGAEAARKPAPSPPDHSVRGSQFPHTFLPLLPSWPQVEPCLRSDQLRMLRQKGRG